MTFPDVPLASSSSPKGQNNPRIPATHAASGSPPEKSTSQRCDFASCLAAAQQAGDIKVTVQVDAARKIDYRVIDARTGTIIQQIPAEDVLRIARNLSATPMLRHSTANHDQINGNRF